MTQNLDAGGLDRAIRCGSGPATESVYDKETYFSCNVNLRVTSGETL